MRQSINVMFFPEEDGLIPFAPSDTIPPKYYTAIQTWALCFLNVPGTRPLDPSYGTFFLPLLKEGVLFSKDDVYNAFADASARCLAYCEADNPGDVYVTEAKITTLDIVEAGGGDRRLVLYVAFSFSDGTKTRINLEVN